MEHICYVKIREHIFMLIQRNIIIRRIIIKISKENDLFFRNQSNRKSISLSIQDISLLSFLCVSLLSFSFPLSIFILLFPFSSQASFIHLDSIWISSCLFLSLSLYITIYVQNENIIQRSSMAKRNYKGKSLSTIVKKKSNIT